MQDYPTRIRKAVLDSPLPPDARYLEENPANFSRALNLLFQKCEADSACQLAYPNLAATYSAVIDSLTTHPFVVEMGDTARYQDGRFVLNAQDFELAVHHALYARAQYPFLPIVINAVRQRNTTVVKAFLQSMKNSLLELHYGIYYAVLCNDCIPANRLKAFDTVAAASMKKLPFYRADFLVCEKWGRVKRKPARPSLPRDVPTLILSGELDPLVPPSYARLAGNKLRNSHYCLFENEGHWVTGSIEGARIVQRFLQDEQLPASKEETVNVYKLKFQTK